MCIYIYDISRLRVKFDEFIPVKPTGIQLKALKKDGRPVSE